MTLNEMLIIQTMKIIESMDFVLYVADWVEDEDEYWDDYRWQKVLKLEDTQQANLWGIEWDQFLNLSQALSRMDTYMNDYYYRDLEETYDIYFDWYDDLMKIKDYPKELDYELFVCKFYLSEKIYKMLEQITPEMVDELIDKMDKDWDNTWNKQDYKDLKMYL